MMLGTVVQQSRVLKVVWLSFIMMMMMMMMMMIVIENFNDLWLICHHA